MEDVSRRREGGGGPEGPGEGVRLRGVERNEADMKVRDRRSREEETPTFKSPLRKKEKGSTPHEVKEEVAALARRLASVATNEERTFAVVHTIALWEEVILIFKSLYSEN